MGGIFNSSEEIAKMAEYPNIRLFRINHATASEPQDDFNGNAVINWVSTTDVNNTLFRAWHLRNVIGAS